ncbi:CHASE2 domain-containing protein, partial [Gloeocapsa sp. PCC 73106]|uniref:CHASE2 domain-containing protein n=1 Tax=Gloeocapsa sp. PCC 73106 TaxID=102232 RepID=UPI0002AC0C17
MTAAQSNYEYQVGGSLDSDAPSYVTREADLSFYQALKAGRFCYVLNSRQMGKSSLRVRTMRRLQNEGTVCAFIDLTGIGTQEVTPEKWYAGIIQSLVSSCQLSSKIQWRSWWREQRDLFSPVQRLSLFIEEVLLVEIKQNIVIFVDEIDRVLSQQFSLDDFFGLIRYFYDNRDTYPDYRRLSFALLGVATPSDLIRDKTQTPFNIGQAIQLQGFQPHEVKPLSDGLQGKVAYPEVVLQEILEWTGGQPFLTQKLCQLVIQQDKFNPERYNSDLVKQVVHACIVEDWEGQDEPDHLRIIRDRILRNEQKVVQLLGMYQKILQRGEIDADGSLEQIELRLSGLVIEKQGKLKVYNPIYQAVFNRKWVEQNLDNLRPYAQAMSGWIASGRRDESCLLSEIELQNAFAWSLGRSLSETDYQFLVASQDLAKQRTHRLLKATEQASKLLASARARAKQEVFKQRIWWGAMPLTVLGMTALIMLLRFGGLLQGLEWDLFDYFLVWRPIEAQDTRVVIVTIDEKDLTQVGQWPIPDGILAEAIVNIKAQNPNAIGLDLYRDLVVEPGHEQLVDVFRSTPNLFGIEKAIANKIAPSPILSQLGQVGFADMVVDADGKVRRALLSVILSDDDLRHSLALKLSLHYLEAKNITVANLDNKGHRVRLGKAVFTRFTGNDGGYVRSESGGYQILINFRGTQENFVSLSLTEVLNNQITPDLFRDRIILIGSTAESIHDFYYTPYSNRLFNSPELMPGIFIHANIISQILSAAIDRRSPLNVYSEPI